MFLKHHLIIIKSFVLAGFDELLSGLASGDFHERDLLDFHSSFEY